MVMVYVVSVFGGQAAVPLVRVHDRRDNILLAARDLCGELVCLPVEPYGIRIAAVPLKVRGVDVEYHLVEYVGVLPEAPVC